jgi:hypothetical protein
MHMRAESDVEKLIDSVAMPVKVMEMRKWIVCALFASKLRMLSKVKFILNSIWKYRGKKKMKMNSDKKFPPASLGATMRVHIPDVDKG